MFGDNIYVMWSLCLAVPSYSLLVIVPVDYIAREHLDYDNGIFSAYEVENTLYPSD